MGCYGFGVNEKSWCWVFFVWYGQVVVNCDFCYVGVRDEFLIEVGEG